MSKKLKIDLGTYTAAVPLTINDHEARGLGMAYTVTVKAHVTPEVVLHKDDGPGFRSRGYESGYGPTTHLDVGVVSADLLREVAGDLIAEAASMEADESETDDQFMDESDEPVKKVPLNIDFTGLNEQFTLPSIARVLDWAQATGVLPAPSPSPFHLPIYRKVAEQKETQEPTTAAISEYRFVKGTEGFVPVVVADTGSGYSWRTLAAYYSPAAGRYYWVSDSGCSCDALGDGVNSTADFEDGSRGALVDAVRRFHDDADSGSSSYERTNDIAAVINFVEPRSS